MGWVLRLVFVYLVWVGCLDRLLFVDQGLLFGNKLERP